MPDINSHYSFSYNFVDNNPESDVPDHNIVHNIDGSADVSNLIETFHRFLLACGFSIPDGFYLDLVKEDSNKRVDLSESEIEED